MKIPYLIVTCTVIFGCSTVSNKSEWNESKVSYKDGVMSIDCREVSNCVEMIENAAIARCGAGGWERHYLAAGTFMTGPFYENKDPHFDLEWCRHDELGLEHKFALIFVGLNDEYNKNKKEACTLRARCNKKTPSCIAKMKYKSHAVHRYPIGTLFQKKRGGSLKSVACENAIAAINWSDLMRQLNLHPEVRKMFCRTDVVDYAEMYAMQENLTSALYSNFENYAKYTDDKTGRWKLGDYINDVGSDGLTLSHGDVSDAGETEMRTNSRTCRIEAPSGNKWITIEGNEEDKKFDLPDKYIAKKHGNRSRA